MAKTYLELVNIVLRDTNEVPLSAGNFDSARGLQGFVKEAINRSLLDIINYNEQWPFLAGTPEDSGQRMQSHSFNTNNTVSEYALPGGIDQVDWNNVMISETDDEDSVSKLEFISYNQVTKLGVVEGDPRYVYQTPNGTYMGLFPRPTRSMKVSFLAWLEPTILAVHGDTLPFEDRYYPVLVSRARYYLWMFRENSQQASMALNEYEDSLRSMFRTLVSPTIPKMTAV